MGSKRNYMAVVKTKPSFNLDINMLRVEFDKLKELDAEHRIKLSHSLETYGQMRNILIDADFNVVEGRNIVRIMRELGHTTVECKLVAAGDILARLALDSEYSAFDFVGVSIELNKHPEIDLTNKTALYSRLPFKNDDIEDYVESLEFSMEQFNAHLRPQQTGLFDMPVADAQSPLL